MSSVIDWIQMWVKTQAHSFYKLIVRVWTGRCELERLALSPASDLQQKVDINGSLRRSSQLYPVLAHVYGSGAMTRSKEPKFTIRPLATSEQVKEETTKLVNSIVTIKRINRQAPETQRTVIPVLTSTLTSVLSINHLVHQLNAATTPYDEQNPSHEKLLLSLWSLLSPSQPLTSRHSSDWEQLGFQGHNPATDFRAMGVLGLSNLVAFSTTSALDASRLLRVSQEGGLRWYSWAITGINLTADLLKLTRERVLDGYYMRWGATMQSFHALYCVVFVRFNEAWVKANPVNVMEFAKIHDEFINRIRLEALYAHIDGYEFLEPLVTPLDKYTNKAS